MNIKNIFKKDKEAKTSHIQKMDRAQLEKVVGGVETVTPKSSGASSASYAATGFVVSEGDTTRQTQGTTFGE